MGEGWFGLRVSNGVFFAGCDKRVSNVWDSDV